MNITETLDKLRESGNFRTIPEQQREGLVDLSSNDYLGLTQDLELRQQLMDTAASCALPLSASASRLLAASQEEFDRLEDMLRDLYPGREALIFNSGYHANTGLISALADRDTLVLADRLVHASIIDGIALSRAKLIRWHHNDTQHLQQLLDDNHDKYSNILIITESVFSMDGDQAPLEEIARIKGEYRNAWLYVDEAHAFGVLGPQGLGLVANLPDPMQTDIVVGTFGKALGSVGAFALTSTEMHDFMVNRARSFIFSTALPPINIMWTRLLIGKMLTMDSERKHLQRLAQDLSAMIRVWQSELNLPEGSPAFSAATALADNPPSHIQPLIVGNARKAIDLSQSLLDQGIKVLPIRTPTVPPGTERLRFSLSAAIPSLPRLKH